MSAATKTAPVRPKPTPSKPKPTATFTAREFNQDLARAKRAAAEGPVIITDRGRPAHVLMSYEAYEAIAPSSPPPPNAGSALDQILASYKELGLDTEALAEAELEIPERTMSTRPNPFE